MTLRYILYILTILKFQQRSMLHTIFDYKFFDKTIYRFHLFNLSRMFSNFGIFRKVTEVLNSLWMLPQHSGFIIFFLLEYRKKVNFNSVTIKIER